MIGSPKTPESSVDTKTKSHMIIIKFNQLIETEKLEYIEAAAEGTLQLLHVTVAAAYPQQNFNL